jgi:hypothetical protein
MKKSNGQINLIKDTGKTHKMPPDAKYGMAKPHGKACSDASSASKIMKGKSKGY